MKVNFTPLVLLWACLGSFFVFLGVAVPGTVMLRGSLEKGDDLAFVREATEAGIEVKASVRGV
jgi:hypothetical protein